MKLRLRKMKVEYQNSAPVTYSLYVDEGFEPLNDKLGQKISIKATGNIFCLNCGRKTSKSWNQGFCFPCNQALAQCDRCIVRPELCHYHKGTCREPKWGQEHCQISHLIYLANSSGIKVGVTRAHQRMTRWIDQGASSAISLALVGNRLDAGLVEVALKEYFPDKTIWRKMLKGEAEPIDLIKVRDEAFGYLPMHPFTDAQHDEPVEIKYPILEYPSKVESLNLDKMPHIQGVLLGIKGQYLILDTGVINLRSYAGYEVDFNF